MKFPHCAATVIAGKLAIFLVNLGPKWAGYLKVSDKDMPELLLQDNPIEFAVALEPISNLDSRHLYEQYFIDINLKNVQPEPVEDVSAVVHETNRIPDSRILIVSDGQILRLDGVPVDDSIEKSSYLGQVEYEAFTKIKRWSNENTQGVEVWFSGEFPDIYPVSKIDTGEIRYSSDQQTKVLLKKAILLDIDSETFLKIANSFSDLIGTPRFSSIEELRSTPFFCTRTELDMLYELVSMHTDQILQIENGSDLETKLNTYKKLQTIQNETSTLRNMRPHNIYHYLRRRAQDEKMIGGKSESCPIGLRTAFQAFSPGAETIGVKILECTCPSCEQPVKALIFDSQIHCPNCGATAPYKC